MKITFWRNMHRQNGEKEKLNKKAFCESHKFYSRFEKLEKFLWNASLISITIIKTFIPFYENRKDFEM